MGTEQLRQRLLRDHYPRRAAAKFTYENDHNPLIREDCPRCRGTGTISQDDETDEGWVAEKTTCPKCEGEGITGGVVPYFINDAPLREACTYADGWIKCPSCGKRFSLSDPACWTGLRHITCGQKIQPHSG